MPTRRTPARQTRAPIPLDAARAPRSRQAPASAFPVVGVGASAGGLDAFRQLLAHVPADSGIAFVLVQHLEPTRESLLSDALAQATTMKVTQAVQGVSVEANRVYVIPPGAQMAIEQGVLKLSPVVEEERRPHLPIDFFLRSLAAERGRQAVGVILSGTASDGTAGLAAIREQGGITFAQDPRSARFGEMPQSAIDAGVVDFCLPLPALGAELGRLARHPYLARSEPVPPTPAGAALLGQVVALVRASTGVDFAEHKAATLKRRLARRMAVRRAPDVASYVEVLRHDPAEVRALHEDLLIKVTSFFRDEESFDELKAIAFPEILRHKPPGAPIRAWVVGCATGEEVYSLAISLIEHLEHLGGAPSAHPVLIFGSDISEKAIAHARAALYPDDAVRGLGEERLRRFFVRSERGWRVSQAVRDLCVFVRHDVARDPPFSRLDLVSCRNVLIYFGQALQRRVLAAAHYCLNQPGYLLLGRSESAAGVPRWFGPASKGGRLYLRKPGPSTFRFARAGAFPFAPLRSATDDGVPPGTGGEPGRHFDDLVLARYGPPGVVVNEHLEVIQFRGRTGPYLEPPAGEPQLQLLKMARAGLAAPLRIALAEARKTSAAVRKERVVVDGAAGSICDLVVLPVKGTDGERAFVVLFEERAPPAPRTRSARSRGRTGRLDGAARRALEGELSSTKEYVAALLEDHGRGNDALASANDELVSGNEELQSLNEELETAREELQSTNEELTTVNDELHGRNEDLQLVNADVLNLLDAVEIPILMLDAERRIRRFTRRASTFMGLTSADVGRRITDVALPLQAPDLEPWIARAMEQSTLVEGEVQDRSDRWHRLQIRPHRAADGRTDGAILSLVDIDELRHEVSTAQWARDYARSVVEAVQVPLVVLDARLRVLSANAAYYRLFHEEAVETEGHGFFELGGGEWDVAELRRAVAAVLGAEGRFQALDLEREFPGAGRRAASVCGCAVPSPAGEPMILLAIEDVTERRQGERHGVEVLALAVEARRRAEHADAGKDLFLAKLSHELRSPLTAILLHAQVLQKAPLDPRAVGRAAAAIEASARRQAKLVEELLDHSRVVTGKLELDLEDVDWRRLVLPVLETVKPEAEAKSVQLEALLESVPTRFPGDPARLQQVVANLLSNAIKFTPSGGRVSVRSDTIDGFARLVVADTGRGIDPAFLPHAFDGFAQEDGPSKRSGLGLGLAIVHHLVELHGGTVGAESPGRDLGSTFTVCLPRNGAPSAS